jgi:hypothetical protein
MTPDPMPEPEGPEDERFVYLVTATGVEALREAPPTAEQIGERRSYVVPSSPRDWPSARAADARRRSMTALSR